MTSFELYCGKNNLKEKVKKSLKKFFEDKQNAAPYTFSKYQEQYAEQAKSCLVPEELQDILLRATNPDPEQRPSMGDLVEKLATAHRI